MITVDEISIKEIISNFKSGQVQPEALMERLVSCIQEEAWVYVVLDHSVALGTYDTDRIQIGFGHTQEIMELDSVNGVQELRVFNEKQEFRAINVKGIFYWRHREDNKSGEQAETICYLDETHKLWGSVKEGDYQGNWSLLRSDRGSAIYFPGSVPPQGEKGLQVRSYIQFNPVSGMAGEIGLANAGLTQFVDERLCGFVDWSEEGRQ